MQNYNELPVKWNSILEKVKKVSSNAYMEIGEKATPGELAEAEAELGYALPPSFRDALIHIGKSCELFYSLSGYTFPDEFRNIAFGGLSWNISGLSPMSLFEMMESDEEQMKNLYVFSHSGNGDAYAFDMSKDSPEKPVVYWDHETWEVTYIADSFREYLYKITQLYCIGDDIWSFEAYLDADGLNTGGEKAKRFIEWFESFLTTELADVRDDFDKLFEFVICRTEAGEQALAALLSYGKPVLFEKLKKTLKESKGRQEAACKLIAEHIGDYARDWVMGLWKSVKAPKTVMDFGGVSLSTHLLSYLSANCLDKAEGAELVTRFLENLTVHDADFDSVAHSHLRFFDAALVIPWMETHIRNRVGYWGCLFVEVKPTWEVYVRWSKLEKIHRKVLGEGFFWFLSKPYKIAGLPQKEELFRLLNELKEEEILSAKKKQIDVVIGKIDCFYS